jgi:hypothetical protein
MTIAISMVMLREDIVLRVSDIQRVLSMDWPDLPAARDISQEANTMSFSVGACDVILGKMPAPIPWSDLEGPCASSILWPKATKEVRQHKVHWIVTVSGELDALNLYSLLTQATASFLTACPPSIGVYWSNATLVIPKNIFIGFAKEVLPHGPPIQIWVDFRIWKDSDTSSSGFTTGMAALGHMEFEAQTVPEAPGDLYDRLLALAGYVIENGPVIKDGDTIGEDANERIRVIYSKSKFGHERPVMRLDYERPSQKRSW